MTDECITIESDLSELDEDMEDLAAPEFTCHCCYDVLVDPTTLSCGHSFCRHCLAEWLHSSQRNECPECRERWQGFPRINILLRDAVEKTFPAKISRRRRALQSDKRFHYFIQIFQQYGQVLKQQIPVSEGLQEAIQTSFCSGVIMALIFMGVVLLRYHWMSADSDILVQKPINRWKPHDVILWVEHLGPWTNQYREMFQRAQINGSLLAHLRDEDLSAAPFNVNNPSHRQVILEEIQKIKELKVKQPQNLWEYKVKEVRVKVALQASVSRVITISNSDYELKEVQICDTTGDVKLTLLDSFVNAAEAGISYAFKNLSTRERDGCLCLCTCPSSSIEQIADLEVAEGATSVEDERSTALFSDTIKGIEVTIQRRCSVCHYKQREFME
ncbi:bifunctional apoptosis regulator isoform X3 [Carassius gibelio]|uniref:bifunctional apoptosis regulator isoform X3 n=1 Tax=Carassius gibelio TaxID=101364 RepID=UPI0022789D6A|nr:bifunctional apoptosis regulator isoform X3 [Carassius gibelio]